MPGNEAVSLALLFAFLVLSAFFSSSEAAFLSLQRTRIAHLLSEGVPGARRVAAMLDEPERLLSTILLGNNLVNVAFSAIITLVVVDRVGPDNEGLGVVIATVLGTVTLLLLGETIPKTIAVHNSEKLAFLYSYPLKWGEYLLLPFVLILQWITKAFSSRFGGTREGRSITEGELHTLIDIGVGEGEFEQEEAERLKGVFRFGDRQVRDVMTPPHGDRLRPARLVRRGIPQDLRRTLPYPLPCLLGYHRQRRRRPVAEGHHAVAGRKPT